jgi:predicted Zn-dependent protease
MRFFSWLLILVAALPAAAATRADAERDPLLRAMLEEMDRSKAQLVLEGFARPFFLEYRLIDLDRFETRAAWGASEGAERTHRRAMRVRVLVGDYKTDSSSPRGEGNVELGAIDDDAVALRSALWAATDRAYKQALAAYAQKQAALKQVQTPPEADDLSHETPVVSLGEPRKLELDEQEWTARVTRSTGLYRTEAALRGQAAQLQSSFGGFQAEAVTARLVNSEGAIVRKSGTAFQQTIAVSAQAADGMDLERSYASNGPELKDLDAEAEFARHAAGLIQSLDALARAPLVEEEYHGPVLLAADAAADTMEVLLGSAVTAVRPNLGTEARTLGPFASSLHARVLPPFLDAVDSPAMSSYQGRGLLGAYAVDDEGVPARTVELIRAGKLENYLIGRQPVRDFPASNGHGRNGLVGPARPSVGVLKVSASAGLTDEEMNRKLLETMKERGLKSAYAVETMGANLTPRLIYKVAADGTRTLVRGAALEDLDPRALRSSIAAAGKDLHVLNAMGGEAMQTVLAPALLFEDLTVKRANRKNDRLPFYPPPE